MNKRSVILLIVVLLTISIIYFFKNRIINTSAGDNLPLLQNVSWLMSEKEIGRALHTVLIQFDKKRMIDSSASYWNNFKIKEIFNMSFLNRPIVVNLFFLDDRLISYGIEIEHVEADEIARCDSEYVAFLKTKYGNPHILSLNPPHSFCVWDTNSTSIYYTSSEIIAHVDNLSPSPIGYANVQRISARMMFYYKPFQDTLHTLSMKYEPPTINNKWRQPNQALKLTE